MSAVEEKQPLLAESTSQPLANDCSQLTVYKRRWWIILVFFLCSATQSAHWNAWNPISDAVQIAYDWNDTVVATFPAISNGTTVILGFYIMSLIESKGLRFGTLLGACVIMMTIALWNIAAALEQYWLVIVGTLFNGIGCSITMAAPALLSVTWFPVNERTTATAIAAAATYGGTAISYLSGPYISGASVTASDVANKSYLPPSFKESLKLGVLEVMYFNAGLALLCFLCVVIYYPAKPPKPPSVSADVERVDFWTGLKYSLSNAQFWILGLAYNVPNGSFNAWLPLISVNFRSLNISEATAGWMGFTAIVCGSVGSIMMAVFIDRFKRKTKLLLQLTSLISVVAFTMLGCIQEKYMPVPQSAIEGVLYLLLILISLSVNGVIPLYYELGCEVAYPVHEGLACSFLTIMNNAFGMTYFLIFLNPTLAQDTEWMTWAALGACALALPLLIILKESYHRLDLETEAEADNLSEHS